MKEKKIFYDGGKEKNGAMVSKKWFDQFSRHFRPFLEEIFLAIFFTVPHHFRKKNFFSNSPTPPNPHFVKNLLRGNSFLPHSHPFWHDDGGDGGDGVTGGDGREGGGEGREDGEGEETLADGRINVK